MKIHIVQKGDTLWKIAKKYGVNFEELKKMNSQLSNPDMIMPGMKIKVPTTGGSVKKEAPIIGAKKEQPIAQQPIVKEQPKPLPVAEAPKKEAPIMPIKEAPKAPVMPQPVIPDIDINNYYMLNMAQMNVQQQPQLPPKPTNILPEVKEAPKKEAPIVEAPKKEAPIKEAPIKEAPIKEAPIKEAPIKEIPEVEAPIEQPIYQEYCVPVSPILPGTGLFPGWCPPPPCPPHPCPPGMPYQNQVMPYEQFPGAMNPGMLPGVENPNYLADMDESSGFMPQLPLTNPMAQNPTAVMGVEDVQQQGPLGMAPAGFGPEPDNCFPTSPVLPGPGGGFAGVPYGGGQMPFQQPFSGQQMPFQQPYGGQQMPFQQPYGGQQMPFQQPYGGQQMPFQQQPYGGQQMPFQQPYEGQQMPFQQQPYGGQQMPFQQQPYGGQQMPFQQPYGGQQMPFQQMPYVGRQMEMQQQMPFENDDQMEMPQMPQMPFENEQMMQQMPTQQMPTQQQPFGGQQMPYQQQPFGGQQMPYQQQPFGGQQMPYQQQPFGGQQMPFESTQMPLMPQGQGGYFESPEQMGMPFNSPHMTPGGFNYDCGCGGPKIQPKAPVNPYGQGTPGVYTPPFGSQMGQPPFMNPYGYGTSPDSDRGFDESSEFY